MHLSLGDNRAMSAPAVAPDITILTYERELFDSGVRIVAGVDEVGRGAIAGPLVSAAIILPPLSEILDDAAFWSNVRDSKTISPAVRESLAAEIVRRSVACATSCVDSDELDSIGVAAANRIAMERAVLALDPEPEVLLIDAMTIDSSIWQIGIIDGDALSLSVAAASIVAKVTRDAMMVAFDATHPAYGFARHKGYGVAAHLAALREHGPCTIHRRSFAPVQLAGSDATHEP
jgi:ribonuclease HII